MVRAAQASPDHGFVGSGPGLHGVGLWGRETETPFLLRVALEAEGRSLPVVHGCGCRDSGAARERSSAHWLPASPRVTRLAPMAWALRAPGRPWQPGHCLALRALGAEDGGAVRPAPTCAPRVAAHVVSWGAWGCRRRRALRAAREARCKACFELLRRARVEWHTARTLLPPPPPRSSGAPRWLMARGRRASGVAAAPRSCAAGAPATRRRRAVGGACACRARSNGRRRPCGGGWGGTAPNYLRWLS